MRRDINHSVSIGDINKVEDHYENFDFDIILNVKDAWNEPNPVK